MWDTYKIELAKLQIDPGALSRCYFDLKVVGMEVMVGLSKCIKKNLFDVSIRICMVQSKHYTR